MLKSISKAAEIAQAGDVITVHAGSVDLSAIRRRDLKPLLFYGSEERDNKVPSPYFTSLAIGGRRMGGAPVICNFFSLMHKTSAVAAVAERRGAAV